MAKKTEINENWEPIEVEDLDNLFIVVFKHGSFDQGYVEAFDTDDVLMQSAYDNLAKQYDDCGCDDLTKIYLIRVPNTEQTQSMCNTGLFNGNCCDPHVIEATRDLFNRADCEHLSCWEGCGLTENKKKKNKPYSSAYCGFTDPALNIAHFNKCMGTGGLQNPDAPHLVVGDTLPNSPVADAGSSAGASDAGSSGGEGGAVGESLTEAKKSISYGIEYGDEYNEDFEEEYFDTLEDAEEAYDEKLAWMQEEDTGYVYINLFKQIGDPEDGNYKFLKQCHFDEDEGDWISESLNEDKDREPVEISDMKSLISSIVDDFNKKTENSSKLALIDVHVNGLKRDELITWAAEQGELGKEGHVTEHYNFSITGGLNGNGEWDNYLKDLSDFTDALKEQTKWEPVVVEVFSDVADDVFTVEFNLFNPEKATTEELQEGLNDRYFICWNKVNPALKKPIIGDEASLRQKFDIVCEVKNIDPERYDFIVFNDTNDGIAYERLMPEVWAENTAYMALRGGDFYREVDLHEDIEKEIKIQNNENIIEDEKELDPPIPLETFPNEMGINLSSVKKEKWVQQEDGQLKTITIEFDPATEEEKEEQGIEESLDNNFWAERDADKNTYKVDGDEVDAEELVDIIYDCIHSFDKDEGLDLSQESIDHCARDTYRAYIKPENKEEIGKLVSDWLELTESLDEAANLNYSEQKDKMRRLEIKLTNPRDPDGRGFNTANVSLEKLLYNYDICISCGYTYARKYIENVLREKGWGQYIKQTKISRNINDYDITPDSFVADSAKLIWAERNNAQKLIDDYDTDLESLLLILIFALAFKEAGLAGQVKDHILNKFTVTLSELKALLNKCFSDGAITAKLNQLIHDCKESLTEDTAYSHKLMKKFEVPHQIKLLDQNKVESFIRRIKPEELFTIGYATPLYFYSELDPLFDLVKATEMEGYTGMDYRDAVADQTAADHDARVANAQRQIDTYKGAVPGKKLNTEGERFSTPYRQVNKLALNPEKSNQQIEYEYELDDDGNIKLDNKGNPIVKTDDYGNKVIKKAVDMSKILFYPKVGSTPITHYYIDFHDRKGFRPIKRELLVDTLYKFIMEVEKANNAGISKADLMWIQKKGYGNVKQDAKSAVEAFYDDHPENYAISIYRKAEELSMPVEEYAKEHPISTRWSMSDFKRKATLSIFDADAATVMAQDAATVSGQELAATRGANRTVTGREDKPQVRALYSNQVYYISGRPGTFGKPLTEGLEEEVKLDEVIWPKRHSPRVHIDYSIKGEDWEENVDIDAETETEAIEEIAARENVDIEDIEVNNCWWWDADDFARAEDDHKQWDDMFHNESLELKEAKRYVKRYYVRPLNIFCGNKEDIIQALIRAGNQNCSVYSLKNLTDHEDVHLLQPSDIIYYWDNHVLYDKNHVQVMDYDLFVKHEEDRKKVGNVDTMSDAAFGDMYDDRATEDDLKDKDVIANYKALNKITR